MSGGSLIALAADEIVMDRNAVLGPVDPQIADLPAGSIVKLPELKKPAAISDEMLILVDVAAKARIQVAVFVAEVLLKHMPKDTRREVRGGRRCCTFPCALCRQTAARRPGRRPPYRTSPRGDSQKGGAASQLPAWSSLTRPAP